MKTIRKIIKPVIAVALCLALVVTAFAAYGKRGTANYGTLSGFITQSGTALTTTTKVTENEYGGFLHSTIELTDGHETKINTSRYKSGAGAFELTNTTYMLGITSPTEIILPEYAAYGVEVRGGSETGDYFTINFDVDSSVFD